MFKETQIYDVLKRLNDDYLNQIYIEKKSYRKMPIEVLLRIILENNLSDTSHGGILKIKNMLEKAKYHFEVINNGKNITFNGVKFNEVPYMNKKTGMLIGKSALKKLLDYSDIKIDDGAIDAASEYLYYEIDKLGKIKNLSIRTSKQSITQKPDTCVSERIKLKILKTGLCLFIFMFIIFLIIVIKGYKRF